MKLFLALLAVAVVSALKSAVELPEPTDADSGVYLPTLIPATGLPRQLFNPRDLLLVRPPPHGNENGGAPSKVYSPYGTRPVTPGTKSAPARARFARRPYVPRPLTDDEIPRRYMSIEDEVPVRLQRQDLRFKSHGYKSPGSGKHHKTIP